MEFVKLNNNPKGIKAADCVVRALSGADNISWEVVYLQLSEIGLNKYRMPNEKQTYEEYLKKHGWEKHKMPKHENGKRYTVEECVKEFGKGNILVISIANHLTYSIEDTLVDSWDCSDRSVCNYWTKPNKSNRKITKVQEAERVSKRRRIL
ncbi:MAG: hypothetical protein ACI3T9_01175 [Romboutsia timonensis]